MGWEQNAVEKPHLMTNERHDTGAEDHLPFKNGEHWIIYNNEYKNIL